LEFSISRKYFGPTAEIRQYVPFHSCSREIHDFKNNYNIFLPESNIYFTRKMRNFRKIIRLTKKCFTGSFRQYTRLGDDRDFKLFDQRSILVIGGTIVSILILFAETFIRWDITNCFLALIQCILVHRLIKTKSANRNCLFDNFLCFILVVARKTEQDGNGFSIN